VDPLVFHDPLARALAGVSAGALGVAEGALQWRTRATRNVASDRGTYWTLAVALTVSIYLAARAPDWVPGLSLSDGGWWPFVVGLGLFWAGAALRWWAIATLGRLFQLTVVVQADHAVVDRGPYAVLRHPSYTGALLIYAGVGFACDNALSVLVCVALPGIAFLRRIRVEEDVLLRELGEPYRAYARRTRRLIPGVW